MPNSKRAQFIDASRWRIEEIAAAAKVTTGAIYQWISRGLLNPGIDNRGVHFRLFTFHDVVRTCVLADLIRAGVPAATASEAAALVNVHAIESTDVLACRPVLDSAGRPTVDRRGREQLWDVSVQGLAALPMQARPIVITPLANLVEEITNRLGRSTYQPGD